MEISEETSHNQIIFEQPAEDQFIWDLDQVEDAQMEDIEPVQDLNRTNSNSTYASDEGKVRQSGDFMISQYVESLGQHHVPEQLRLRRCNAEVPQYM